MGAPLAYDYEVLKAELLTDPLKRGYAGMSDVEVADDMNAVSRTGPVLPVSIDVAIAYLRAQGVWPVIKAAAAGGGANGLSAGVLVDLNADLRMKTIDFSLPLVQQIRADLIAKGLLTQEHADVVTAMSTSQISRAVEIGWGPCPVYWGDINRIRIAEK